MQSRKDAALRAIVENTKLPIKVRREALAEMEAPSRLFLTRMANGDTVPAKLRLDAARRIPKAERRLSEGKKKIEPTCAEQAPADQMDDAMRKLLTDARRPTAADSNATEPPATTTPTDKPRPQSEHRPAPAATERQPTPPTTAKPGTGLSPAPKWMHTVEEPGDGQRFVDRLAARRQRDMHDTFAMETTGVSFAALQANMLAEEAKRRATPPKRRYAGMPTCGDALNGET